MKVYKVYWEDPSMGMLQMWFPTQAKAKQFLADTKASIIKAIPGLKSTYDRSYSSGVELLDVPTTRTALIDWLNENCTEDNG